MERRYDLDSLRRTLMLSSGLPGLSREEALHLVADLQVEERLDRLVTGAAGCSTMPS